MKIDLKQRASELVREDESFVENLREAGHSPGEIRKCLMDVETAAITYAGKATGLEALVKKVRALKKAALR